MCKTIEEYITEYKKVQILQNYIEKVILISLVYITFLHLASNATYIVFQAALLQSSFLSRRGIISLHYLKNIDLKYMLSLQHKNHAIKLKTEAVVLNTMFHGRKKIIQVWNNRSVCENFPFSVNIAYNIQTSNLL